MIGCSYANFSQHSSRKCSGAHNFVVLFNHLAIPLYVAWTKWLQQNDRKVQQQIMNGI